MKWTYEKCKEEALKYKTRIEFQINSKGSYLKSFKEGWLDEICSHMIKYFLEKEWSYEKCKEEALKYKNRTDFQSQSRGAYLKANRQGWLDEICSHMIILKKKNGYWTKEKCKEEALKYKTKVDFQKNSSTAYRIACELKIIDEICSHMIVYGNIIKRCIYSYEFEDNSVYVGLTYNIENRKYRHLNNVKSIVFKKINQKIKYNFKQLTNYIDIHDAKNLEEYYVTDYKNKNWNILNTIKTGGLGGNIIKWNKEKCKKEALKYSKRSDFKKDLPGAYRVCRLNNWLDEFFN